ncbi:DUF5671 domain-containing protein [Marivita sp. XM-24bin2]|jgi:hypothetical protein|uniref:DUF5671 domain-containing protein n=1 Tax=unclassified Marivita TaxID=2632480 RepID=UPI000D7B20C9|nr:DUF5671 domain-containing protein [Marivita sp. XM-24bin2]MCR9109502.1 DUF5671 domain-containing protein [Paracoccaceae bacterium]PWL35708.1 MAG: hypothetical protein DCO97_08000 [Marivita sp. XM-24bin2]
MHVPPDLSDFVRDALNAGRTPDDIRRDLISADWTDTEINAALAGWQYQHGAGAVPRPIRSGAARDALFYSLLFVVFGMVVGSTLTLLFAQINIWLPESGVPEAHGRLSGLRWSMAALIVFVPVFWALDSKDRQATTTDPARRHGTVRRWLSALAMLVATITLLGDALYLIYSWLDGQITLRFLVKSATVAVIAGVVLAYFGETRTLPKAPISLPAGWVLIGLAVLSLGLAFWRVGGPAQGQMEQRDQWRISDLRTLANDVAQCPGLDRTNLPELLDPMTCARNPSRLTGFASAIIYERTSSNAFSLCVAVEYPEAVASFEFRMKNNTACIDRRTD